jgi:putative transposase
MSPVTKMLSEPSVARPCPDSDTLRRAFRVCETRSQRKSDGTISVEGAASTRQTQNAPMAYAVRASRSRAYPRRRRSFEVPSRLRHLERLTVRYARWDLSSLASTCRTPRRA